MKTISCTLCGGDRHETVRVSPDFDFFPGETFTYVRCTRCGLVFLDPQPGDIARYYPDDYYITPRDAFYDFSRFNRAAYVAKHRPPGNLLDIGSNRGFFLNDMRQRGWDVHGCELSPFACDYARNELGLKNITCANFLDAPYPGDFFDAITLWNVIEHLPDPLAALRKAFTLLKPGGTIHVDTQNFGSPFSRFFKEYWYQLDAPRHLFQFTPDTLGKALSEAGFTPASIKGCEPFITMVSFKVSVTRKLGRARKVERILPSRGGTAPAPLRRNVFWIAARESLNVALLAASACLTAVGLGDTMLVSARKDR